MSKHDYTRIILDLSTKVDAITQSFTVNGYKAMSQALAKPLGTLCVLFIILTGYSILRGLIKTPMQEFIKVAIRIGVVYMLAMNWDVFASYFLGLFVDGASGLGGVMMKANQSQMSFGGRSNINGSLQSVFTDIINVGSFAVKKSSYRNLTPWVTGMLIYISGIAVVGLAFFEILLAKLMLAICMSVAPLFFCFTLFDQTRSYFDRWLGTLVGYSMLLVFVSTVVGICLEMVHWVISPLQGNQSVNITMTDWIPLLLVSALSIMAILAVTGVAKGIGGSCSTSGTGSAMVGGFMGSALGLSKGASKLTGLTRFSEKASNYTKKAATQGLKRAGSVAMRGIQNRLRGGA